MYTNTDVLTNKLTEIETIAHLNNIDVITINETLPKRLPDKYTSAEDYKFLIKGYKTVHNNKGRGICIFIKESLVFEQVSDYDHIFNLSIVLKFITPDKEILTICLIYRSLNSSEDENNNLLSLIDTLNQHQNSSKHKLLILGDFNLPGINWELECTKHTDINKHFDSRFLECIHSNFLTQHVTSPTHYRAEQNPTLIDLILTNDPKMIQSVCQEAPLGNSHHQIITFVFPLAFERPAQNKVKTVYLYDKGDYNGMRTFVGGTDWDVIFNLQDQDINTWKSNIEKVIENAQNKFLPKKKISGNVNKKPKRTFEAPDYLLTYLHNKRKAFKYYKSYPTARNYKDYCYHRELVNSASKKARRDKELKIAKGSKANPKLLFDYVASQTKPREGIANLLNDEGVPTESDSQKCAVLNNFFTSVFVDEGDGPVPDFKADFNSELNDVNINEEDMYNVLKGLNASKSPGPDNIHPRVLKELARELSYPFTLLFNKTLKDGKIPDSWKLANVKPIFKKGKKNSAGNYRPVSLTSILCKVFERFIRDALCDHLVKNNLLSKNQFGFCKGRSCVSQLLVTMEEWFQSLDKDIPVDAAYLDFRKAFDSVPHKRLISKLSGYGVRGPVLAWITDFLTNRYQYVSINNEKSEQVPVTSGVPQGSVLGPSLFIYFINDLPDVTNSLLKIFADDTKVYSAINSEEDRDKLQHSIDQMVKWTDKWMIKFNGDKCKILHLGKNNPKYQYFIKEGEEVTVLKETKCEKDLGVNVDPELNFNDHIHITVKKGRKMSGLILRNLISRDGIILLPLYKSLIRPVLEYGNAVWSPYWKKDIQIIEKVQQHFTKRINGLKDLSYEERLVKLKLPSLEYRRLRGDLIEVFKIVNNIYDHETTNNLFKRDLESKTRAHSYKLTKDRALTRKYLHFFSNRVINNWNGLPEHIVSSKSLNLFKNRIDEHFSKLKYTTGFTA